MEIAIYVGYIGHMSYQIAVWISADGLASAFRENSSIYIIDNQH